LPPHAINGGATVTLISNAGTAALDVDEDLIRVELPGQVAMLSIWEANTLFTRQSRRQVPVHDEDGLQIGWLTSGGGDGATLEITETQEVYALTKSRLLDLMCGAIASCGISQFVRGVPA
jgi:hypothetical protein